MAGAASQPTIRTFAALQGAFSPTAAAAILAVVFAAAGAVVFLSYGPVGASTPAEVAAAPDSAVHFAGRIETAWIEGDASMTHFQFVDAPSLDLSVPGNLLARFPRGSFVEVSGSKQEGNVTAHSIRAAREPLSSSAPFFAVASGLAAGLVTHLLMVRSGPEGSPFAGLAARLRQPRARTEEDKGEGGQREADNHSGAPAPKS